MRPVFIPDAFNVLDVKGFPPPHKKWTVPKASETFCKVMYLVRSEWTFYKNFSIWKNRKMEIAGLITKIVLVAKRRQKIRSAYNSEKVVSTTNYKKNLQQKVIYFDSTLFIVEV